mgnify:CR=1 FL=1
MNEEFGYLDSFLAKFDKFVISTHESPDWDGMGGEIALFELLKKLGKKPLIINSDPTPDNFLFLDLEHDIHVIDSSYSLPDDIDEYAQFVLDTNDYDNIGAAAYNALKDRVREVFIIDHHENEGDILAGNLVQKSASSTAEILHPLLAALGVKPDRIVLCPPGALPRTRIRLEPAHPHPG